jgi:hypothetical protein
VDPGRSGISGLGIVQSHEVQIQPNSQSTAAAALRDSPKGKRGIAMSKFARVFVSVLLLAAAGLGVGCGYISEGKFNPDKFWLKQAVE